MSEIKNR